MELSTNTECCPRPVRLLLALVLAVVTIVLFRKEKRLGAVLSGVGAVALGYTAIVDSSSSDDGDETDATVSETDTTASDPSEMRCAICGEPIVVGQSRRPNPKNEIVHEACLDSE